jgi:DNA invertase Pin-like site-specific DNA recombinase
MTRAALYARVSTPDQQLENQWLPLRDHAHAREWVVQEFSDVASGARDRRPGLAALRDAVRRRKVDVVAVVKLDRLARSVRHLTELAAEFEALGVGLVVLDQAIDTTTPVGRLVFHVLGAIAEFERALIVERVHDGIKRARRNGTKSGKPIGRPRVLLDVSRARRLLASSTTATLRSVARELGVTPSTLARKLGSVPKP